MMILSERGEIALKKWLLSRESDIAHGEEDFGDLRDIFKELFSRRPEE